MKYYTAFLYKDKVPNELHCTHKYFGALDDKTVAIIICGINNYLDFNTYQVPTVEFIVPDLFGHGYKSRVLKPKLPYPKLLPELKAGLDGFAKDIYKTYRPHVTCNLESIYEPFHSYALVGSGGVIIKEWVLT